ncbi:DNA mismatch repair protein MutS [Faunimonas pinastri]|uniref:DNA mismatch repair protein MutS n=1 Tax=Faunimonas pinastri TaxID=1855383 RepID=A0A1H9GKT6_9HYPH|nr:DNA mismatch repair protein MutS [Faunimonas pinastri]SEQ50722.1 DNA mismatch repair protein MutS [Faunimonas pinastri]
MQHVQTTESGEDPAAQRITPMMEQYMEIRAVNPDCLLFYRMGDFYELFFDDAVIASKALGITLTKRGKHLGEDIAMCGVPIHASDDYLHKLIAKGFRIAICEQTEDPAEARKRGSKSVVRRAVTRLVTPGTLTEETLLDSARNNFLAALVRVAGSEDEGVRFAVSWVDISTGEFRVGEGAPSGLSALLARIEPREVLVPDRLAQDPEIRAAIADVHAALTPLPGSFFDAATAETRLATTFGVQTMDGFGAFTRAEFCAAAALIAYVDKTQISRRPPLEPLRRVADRETMRIDAATRANLELFRTLSGSRAGSLFAAIDRTLTGAGSRLLGERLANPLCDPGAIEHRLAAVAYMLEAADLRRDLRARLAQAPDMVRSLSRLALERGGPRDLETIRVALKSASAISDRMGRQALPLPPAIAETCRELARVPADLAHELGFALDDELPLLKRDGGFVRAGYRAELDEARALRDESRRVIAALQARYAEETGVRALKIRHNNVLGYFVEVNAGQAAPLTAEGGAFIHRQTLANAMRFTTAELGELERRIAGAGETSLRIELGVFDHLAAEVEKASGVLRAVAKALAELDVTCALAELAEAESYVRPEIDDSLAFDIKGGRHPVVEQGLRREGQSFVANDTDLGGDAGEKGGLIWLLTGPNMAGKSTFLRQNALIAILAQAGSFVPAASARIGVVDSVFSRVGAADDLARGRSTFMVEMVETAAILNQAGERALVILDEIGRGTATFDGLSIAWATVENLHDVNRCRALFATHYHELTALSARLKRLHNTTVKVKEWKGDVVFLHEIMAGAADRSYGIQVAKLAGLPAAVIGRAKTVLQMLEKGDRTRPQQAMIDDLPLFASRPKPSAEEPVAESPTLKSLDGIQPDDLTPRQALEALYELKRLRRQEDDHTRS